MASRPIPDVFLNQTTYGVTTDRDRDTLPSVDKDTIPDLSEVLVGTPGTATRVAIAALQKANETEEIARLVIGAIVDSSRVGATKSRLKGPYVANDWSKKLKDWVKASIAAKLVSKKDDEASADIAIPEDVFPDWLKEMEIDSKLLLDAFSFDEMEVAAYAGILAFAISKQPTPDNLKAFNQNRRTTVQQFIPSAGLGIFTDESQFLDIDTLGKVHRTFNSITKDRALVLSAVVSTDDALASGTKRMFYTLFRLSAGASLNPLLIILRFGRKHPDMYRLFPELETEYHAVEHALNRFFQVESFFRLYLKVIFGSSYIPINRKDVEALLGVATFVLKQSEKSLENYRGGVISLEHRNRIINYMGLSHAGEETIPENKDSVEKTE